MDVARKNAPASNGKSSHRNDAKYMTKVHKHADSHARRVVKTDKYEMEETRYRCKDRYENVQMRVLQQRTEARTYTIDHRVETYARKAVTQRHEVKYENAHTKVHQRIEVHEVRARRTEMQKNKHEAKHGNENLRIKLEIPKNTRDAKVVIHVQLKAAMDNDKAQRKKLMGN